MQFRQDAKVMTAEGESAGELHRVVMEPRSKTVTHIVVRKGLLLKTDKVVPVDLIARADDEGVRLKARAGDLETLPDYEESRFAAPGEGDRQTSLSNYPMAPAIFTYPASVSDPAMTPGPQRGAGAPLKVERNIPDDTITLGEGAHVVARDGEPVGEVEQVITDPHSGRATHFAMGKGPFKRSKLIPVDWVEGVSEGEVRLAVGRQTLEGLPDRDGRG